MKTKFLGILIILLGLAAIFVILYFTFLNRFFSNEVTIDTIDNNANSQVTEQNFIESTNNIPIVSNNSNNTQVTTSQIPEKREVTGTDLKRIAMSFAERYGSYSNQSNFANMTDLKIFMSRSMKDWVDDFIQKNIGKGESKIYYGITTKAVAGQIINFDSDEGRAEIIINTLRSEATGTTDNTSTINQDISLEFILENGAWKVNRAVWK